MAVASAEPGRNISADYQALLQGVAEELKLPLLIIARQAELALLSNTDSPDALGNIAATADAALELVDSYLLGLQLAEYQQALTLEPVSVTSTLYDVAHTLNSSGQRYGVELRLDLHGIQAPVMANRPALVAALLSLGTAFIEAQAAAFGGEAKTVTLAACRTRGSVAAGIYGNIPLISAAQLRRAFSLHARRARQPLNQLSATSAAGLFVAHQILTAMGSKLKTAHYHKQAGLAAFLQPSQQLQFI